MNGKQVIDKLKAAGWTLARINGSHHMMEKDGMPRAIPVPVQAPKTLGLVCLPTYNARQE